MIVLYKVDRLTRSLADFAKIVETFDGAGVSFVSVTQAFNTTNSMGRLTLNVLLSFAQFEREVTLYLDAFYAAGLIVQFKGDSGGIAKAIVMSMDGTRNVRFNRR